MRCATHWRYLCWFILMSLLAYPSTVRNSFIVAVLLSLCKAHCTEDALCRVWKEMQSLQRQYIQFDSLSVVDKTRGRARLYDTRLHGQGQHER